MTKLKESISNTIELWCENSSKPDTVVRLRWYSEDKQFMQTVEFTYLFELKAVMLLKILCSAICYFWKTDYTKTSKSDETPAPKWSTLNLS